MWCPQNQGKGQRAGGFPPPRHRGTEPQRLPATGWHFSLFALANVQLLVQLNSLPGTSLLQSCSVQSKMRMNALAREETDRMRGLARAAWARLKRDDLSSDEQDAAQEEYARTRDELRHATKIRPYRRKTSLNGHGI